MHEQGPMEELAQAAKADHSNQGILFKFQKKKTCCSRNKPVIERS